MNDSLIFITKEITFDDLKKGRKKPIDVYDAQLKSWLIGPLHQLAADRRRSFENGYAMFALELLFFEPHGSYRHGNSITGSKRNFDHGFIPFLTFLRDTHLIEETIFNRLRAINIYSITRCGIYHTMTIKSGLLMESRLISSKSVFYPVPGDRERIIANPWNFLDAMESYIAAYISEVRNEPNSVLSQNFDTTFKTLFTY